MSKRTLAKVATTVGLVGAVGTALPTALAASAPTRPPVFDPYQVEYLRDQSPLKVCSKCRRSGITFVEAFDAVYQRVTGKRTSDYWYSGRDESTAREFAQYVRLFARDVFGRILEIATGEEIVDGKAIKTFTATLPPVAGAGGRVREPRITAMTSSADNFRSKGGDVCLDEFAFHPDQAALWTAASMCALRGGVIRVISTHAPFPEMFEDLVAMGKRRQAGTPKPLDKPVSLHTIDLDRAIAEGLVERVNMTEGTSYSRREYRERAITLAGDRADSELFCKTGSQHDSYLPYELTRPLVRAGLVPTTDKLSVFLAALHAQAARADSLYAGSDGRVGNLDAPQWRHRELLATAKGPTGGCKLVTLSGTPASWADAITGGPPQAGDLLIARGAGDGPWYALRVLAARWWDFGRTLELVVRIEREEARVPRQAQAPAMAVAALALLCAIGGGIVMADMTPDRLASLRSQRESQHASAARGTYATLPLAEMDAYLRRLAQFPDEARRRALPEAAEAVLSEAQTESPRLTGFLSDAHDILADDTDKEGGAITIGANTSYAMAVHETHPTKKRWFTRAVVQHFPRIMGAMLTRLAREWGAR